MILKRWTLVIWLVVIWENYIEHHLQLRYMTYDHGKSTLLMDWLGNGDVHTGKKRTCVKRLLSGNLIVMVDQKLTGNDDRSQIVFPHSMIGGIFTSVTQPKRDILNPEKGNNGSTCFKAASQSFPHFVKSWSPLKKKTWFVAETRNMNQLPALNPPILPFQALVSFNIRSKRRSLRFQAWHNLQSRYIEID